MSRAAPKILLVCNPGDRAEIEEILAGAGVADVSFSPGSDDAVAQLEGLQPDVAIVCAGLDSGDARALVAALRDGAHGRRTRLILIGENEGPIRTALDASDFGADRFIGRPLAAKALLFAVRTLAQAAGKDAPPGKRAATSGTLVSAAPPPAPPRPGTDASEPAPAVIVQAAAAPAQSAAAPAPEAGEAATAPDADDRPRPDGAFARELRNKMSAMAERLFPGQRLREHEGLAHHHAAEIDLSSFGMDTVTGVDEDESAFERLPRTIVQEPGSAAGEGDADSEGAELDFGAQITKPRIGRSASPGAPTPGVAAPDAAASPPIAAPFAVQETLAWRGEGAAPGGLAGRGPAAAVHPAAAAATVISDIAGDALPLEGHIRRGEADAAILIERMYRRRFTGRLELRQEGAAKEILFDKGRPVFASSSLEHDRMGELLLREGKISGEQLREVHALVARSGRRMGEVLIDQGWLKRRELLPVVRRHIEDIVYSLFAWESGRFAVVEGDFAAAERIRISRHPAAMVLEGVRRKFDGETLEALLGSPESILEIVDDRKLKTVVSVADLSSAERKVIGSFDGERSLGAVHVATSVDLVEVYQLAYGLVVWGAAQSLRRGDEGQILAPDEPALIGETDLAIDRQRVLAKYSLVVEADYFSLLGVRRDATSFEIRRAYESARRDYAGEAFPPEVRGELGAEIAEINEVLEEAYLVLRDDALRASYLAHLHG